MAGGSVSCAARRLPSAVATPWLEERLSLSLRTARHQDRWPGVSDDLGL